MSEKDKLRGIIAEIVREEIKAIMKEANEEIVRAELFPGLRSTVRESISKELESVAFEYGHKLEGKERGRGEEEVLASVATSEDEPTITMEAGGEEAVPSEEVVSQPQTAMATMAEEAEEEIRKIKVEMQSKGPGVAYMYRQKIETVIKKEMELRIDTYFKNFYEKIRSKVEDIKMEKTKKTEKDKVMMMNLSVLVSDEKSLGSVLEEIDKEEIFSVRFTGPWQPYSFV